MEFYLLKNGERAGPFKIFHIVEMLRSNEVKDTDMAWCSSDDQWMPLKDIPAMEGLIGDPVEEEDLGLLADPAPRSKGLTKESEETNPARPWMRYMARFLDYNIMFGILAFAAVQLGWASPGVFAATSPDVLTATGLWILSTYTWVFIEAWFLCRYGATFGKFLFNIRIVHQDGSLMTYKEALRRSLTVCFRGYGLGIFYLREMLCIMSFIALTQDGKTPWDEQQSLTVAHGGMQRSNWITVFAVAIGLLTFKSFVAYKIDPVFREMIDEQQQKTSQTTPQPPMVMTPLNTEGQPGESNFKIERQTSI